jgi:hypothetical protein
MGKKKEMVGPTFGGGNGGPPEMEGGRGNLEGPQKWRAIWRSYWSCVFFTKPLKFGVEAHMEAPTGVALRPGYCRALLKVIKYLLLYAKHLTM